MACVDHYNSHDLCLEIRWQRNACSQYGLYLVREGPTWRRSLQSRSVRSSRPNVNTAERSRRRGKNSSGPAIDRASSFAQFATVTFQRRSPNGANTSVANNEAYISYSLYTVERNLRDSGDDSPSQTRISARDVWRCVSEAVR